MTAPAARSSLHDRQILLLLDNLEQVLDAASDLAELLAACPRIAFLITSREPLHLRSEHDFPLGPLPAPDPVRVITAGAAARYPSVELFVERARAVHRGFTLSDGNAAAIGVLCARLDGLPLAIELAAARARHQHPDQLVAGLADRFSLLSGGFRDLPDRQRTMRAAIAWSYDLLPWAEQALFRRIAIFVGGFTADAAVSIAAPANPGFTRDRLGALVDKGLLRLDDGAGEPRYAMFETIREYGLELLAGQGELEEAGRAHALWCVALVEEAGPELTGAHQGDWLDRLEQEHPNIRAALDRLIGEASDRSGELALRLAAPLWRFWWSKGYNREGRAWVEQALAMATHAPPELRALGHYAAGELAEELTDYDAATAHFDAALAIRRELNDPAGMIEVLNGLGIVARNRGEFERAEALHLEALALHRQVNGAPRMFANTYNNLGAIAYFRGDTEQAAHFWEEALVVLRALEDLQAITALLGNLGALALMRRDLDRAIACHQEAIAISRRIDDFSGTTRGLINYAGALYERGDYPEAASIYEESLERCRRSGDRMAESVVLYNLGKIAELSDDVALAESRYGESLTLFHAARNLPGVAACLEQIAALTGQRGDDLLAVRLLAAADTLRTATGAAREPVDHGEYERELGDVKARLGEAAFTAAWAEGAAWSADEAVARALGECMATSAERPELPKNAR
jgi:non-specific serine/threonine protein kinase